MSVLDWLKQFPYKPWNPAKPDGSWSTSDLIRACKDGAILMNGTRIESKAEMTFPISSLVFFPSGKRRTTIY